MPYSALQGRLPGLPSQNRLGGPLEPHPRAAGEGWGGPPKIGFAREGLGLPGKARAVGDEPISASEFAEK